MITPFLTIDIDICHNR